jgi:hypothetical protein
MHGHPYPGRAGSELDEPLLDALLDGQPLPPDAPEQAHVVAEMLASLAGSAGPGELTGEAAARTAYALAAAAARPAAHRPARRRPSWLPVRVRAWLAAVLAAAVLGLGGAAAAYAGALPGPIQDLAHHVIGAPPADRAPSGRAAAYRLCREYEHAMAQDPASAKVDASQKLARAAGGMSKIEAYCAAAGWPGLGPAAHSASNPKPQPGNGEAAGQESRDRATGLAGQESRDRETGLAGQEFRGRATGQAGQESRDRETGQAGQESRGKAAGQKPRSKATRHAGPRATRPAGP